MMKRDVESDGFYGVYWKMKTGSEQIAHRESVQAVQDLEL